MARPRDARVSETPNSALSCLEDKLAMLLFFVFGDIAW